MAAPRLLKVEVWAKDLLCLTFSNDMLIDTNLKSASSYSYSDGSASTSERVVSVVTNEIKSKVTKEVFIEIQGLIVDKLYTLTVSSSLVDHENNSMDSSYRTKKFYGIRTKIDNILDNIPNMYDKSVNSQLRAVLHAFGNSDDIIGGSRNDRL